MYAKAGEWTRNLLWGRRCEKTGKRMMVEEEQFLSFRLWKEHKGVVFLFGLFTLLFSAFYLILIGGWQAEGAAVILSCGLMASLGNLMLSSSLGEGKLPGKAFDRGLEIYVRLKSYFDRLVKSGTAVILSCSVTAMSAFVYDANNVVRLGMLGTGRKHDRSIAVSALAEWARAVGIDNKTIPSGLLAFVLWLLIAATVCLYGYHFYRCFRLYFWNETWEATYREKLEHSGVAPNISTVPFPKW